MQSSKHHLSPLAEVLVQALEQEKPQDTDRKLTVNPLVSQVATWFEKLRKAMEYREEEVILRATIERILRRRLLLGGNAKTTAEPLVKELLWARYLPDDSVSERKVMAVEESIDLHLQLRFQILGTHRFNEFTLNEWVYHLMSADIEHILNNNPEKETVGNFMFQLLKEHIEISDDSEETRDAQVYIGVRRAFARDDIAFLRYNLFRLYFGQLTRQSLPAIVQHFHEGYKELLRELTYPRKDRIFSYIKKRNASFLILEEVLKKHKSDIRSLLQNEEALKQAIHETCEEKYKTISVKVRTAIIRSVLFILLTKVMFAFFIEGTYERIMYGEIQWDSILINIAVPPLLMVIVGLCIRTPGEDNTARIYSSIQKILYENNPMLGNKLTVQRAKGGAHPLTIIFTLLWFLAFALTFGGMVYILTMLNFNFVSQGMFLFFLTIVSFLSYRITQTAHLYTVGDKQGWFTPIADFLFMPIIRVGRQLTSSISQINILLFLFDFLIEAPFKLVFAFFEEWFKFLHNKREELDGS